MPIGGFVVTAATDAVKEVKESLRGIDNLTMYGDDQEGNLIVVLDTETSDEMERLVDEIKSLSGVLSVGAAYLNFEDEIEKIEKGIIKPEIRFGRKPQQ